TAARAPSAGPPEEEEEDLEEEEPEDEGLSESERTDRAMARYQRSTRGIVAKMHPKHREDLLGALGGASDHLHKMSHCEPGAFGRRHKDECLVHARALDRHHGMIRGLKEEPPAPPPLPPQEAEDEEGAAPVDTEEVSPGRGGFLDEKDARAILEKLDAASPRLDGLETAIRRINPSWLR